MIKFEFRKSPPSSSEKRIRIRVPYPVENIGEIRESTTLYHSIRLINDKKLEFRKICEMWMGFHVIRHLLQREKRVKRSEKKKNREKCVENVWLRLTCNVSLVTSSNELKTTFSFVRKIFLATCLFLSIETVKNDSYKHITHKNIVKRYENVVNIYQIKNSP